MYPLFPDHRGQTHRGASLDPVLPGLSGTHRERRCRTNRFRCLKTVKFLKLSNFALNWALDSYCIAAMAERNSVSKSFAVCGSRVIAASTPFWAIGRA